MNESMNESTNESINPIIQLAAVDTEVMDELYTMVDNAATFVAIVAVVVASYWQLLVVMAPVVAVSVGVGMVYQRTSQELKRLDSTTRSPIYGQFSELLSGSVRPSVRPSVSPLIPVHT